MGTAVRFVAALLTVVLAGRGHAEPPDSTKSPRSFSEVRRGLPEVLKREKIRIFYAIEGPHSVASDDVNGNAVPDQVEDIATQTEAAFMLWTGLGFPDPLKTERYRSVSWLDIHLLSREFLGKNGIAYDEIQHFRRAGDPEGTGSLCFDVANSVHAPQNLTPAHEVFHLIQNGATYFKNRWFTEGTARWSERGLGTGGLGRELRRTDWPPRDDQLEEIFSSSYEAAFTYWEPMLLKQQQPNQTIPEERLPTKLLKAQYLNGEPVLKDLELTGWEIVRDVLFALGRADDAVYRERELERWRESEQKSNANSPAIHRTVLEISRSESP